MNSLIDLSYHIHEIKFRVFSKLIYKNTTGNPVVSSIIIF